MHVGEDDEERVSMRAEGGKSGGGMVEEVKPSFIDIVSARAQHDLVSR